MSSLVRLSFFLFLFYFGSLAAAYAQCINGLPCVVNKTANDPSIDTDGPNAAGMPNASKSESDACDADFMNQIYARSFLETEREMMLAETAIRKPDSVLELTCYDQMAYLAALKSNPIFAHEPGANNPPSHSETEYMEQLTAQDFETYISENFDHSFLARPSGGIDYTTGNYAQDPLDCDSMAAIANLARCLDFDMDGHEFYTFDRLVNLDPRLLPDSPACPASANVITADIIDVAENTGFTYVDFDVFTPFKALAYDTSCKVPLDTGLTYKKQEYGTPNMLGNSTVTETSFDYKFCLNPLCYYDRDSNSCQLK